MENENKGPGKSEYSPGAILTACIGGLLFAVGVFNVVSVSGKSLSEGSAAGFENGLKLMFGMGLSFIGGLIGLIGLVVLFITRTK